MQQTWENNSPLVETCGINQTRPKSEAGTFVDVGVEVAVFLGVSADLAVVLVDEDAHLGQQLHLLLVQVFRGYLRHSARGGGAGRRQPAVKKSISIKYEVLNTSGSI